MAPDFEIDWETDILRMISFFPARSQVERHWNSRIEDCYSGWLGDDPHPEIGDAHSSRIDDCEFMRTVSLYFWRLHPNQFEQDQVWLEEDESQPETGYPT